MIQSFYINFAGENNNIVPRIGRLYAPDNTLSEVTAAGFLDNYILTQNFSLLPTDLVAVAASDGNNVYQPQFTDGSCQLVNPGAL